MKQAFTYYELFVIKTGLDSKETRTVLVNYVIKELTKPVAPAYDTLNLKWFTPYPGIKFLNTPYMAPAE